MVAPSPPHGALATDSVTAFQLESGLLRGRLVRASGVLDEILDKHGYPYPVARLLAETVVTGTALATMLKFNGRFTLQARGDGPVKLVVADTTHLGGLRGYVHYDADAVTAMGDEGIGLLGQGHLAFTIEPPEASGQERYQGIVALRGKDMAAAAQNYFRQSEQIPTGLMTAVVRGEDGHWHGACLIVQQMPEQGGDSAALPQDMTAAELWQHTMVLMSSCTVGELLDSALAPATLLYRLFHAEGVQINLAQPLRHECTCADRITAALRLFSRAEVEDMAENGVVKMTCQFCNRQYDYDAAAIAAIFAEPSPDAAG